MMNTVKNKRGTPMDDQEKKETTVLPETPTAAKTETEASAEETKEMAENDTANEEEVNELLSD